MRSGDKVIQYVYRKDYSALLALDRCDLNAQDADGRTPLMHAVLASDADPRMVQFLMGHGADREIRDKGQGWTALHFAARDQKRDIVGVLLGCGANVDPEDAFGNTPLWRCIMAPRTDPVIVRLLLEKGAKSDKANRSGVSAKSLAERAGATEILSILNERK